MPIKTFNSETAKKLAMERKLKINDIPTHRVDGKITIQNVRNYIKQTKVEKPKKEKPKKVEKPKKEKPKKEKPKKVEKPKKEKPIKGYHVELKIMPIGTKHRFQLYDNLMEHNLNMLVKYYKELLPLISYQSDSFKNPKVSKDIVQYPSRVGIIVFNFDVMKNDMSEVNYCIKLATDIDSDGNNPIQVLDGKIVNINAKELDPNEDGDEDGIIPGLTLITQKVLERSITPKH